MKSLINVFAATCVSLLWTAGPTEAGEITGFTWSSGIGSVAGISVPPPVAVNNDNVVGDSPNEIEVLQKHYLAIGPVDIEFYVADSGGTTEYVVVEGVSNNTTLDWSSYTIQLGFGMGPDFEKSDSGDGLDFDASDYDSTVMFDPPGLYPFPFYNNVGEDQIDAYGGVLPDGAYAEPFVFHIDVPDGIDRFTLRQFPVPVPEPATLSLAVLGFLAVGSRRRGPGAR